MANLLGEPFREYVDDQIRVRQNVHGKKNRTTAELQYLNTRNAWIKMASAVSIDKDRLDLLKNLTEFDKNGKPIKRSRNNELLQGIYDGKNLALKNVLFGGLSSFGKIFRDGTDKEREVFGIETRSGITGTPYSRAYGVGGTEQFGYSPMPGITDMSFKCLNRGSIKKMSLNIKCHNRSQFDVIDVLYLRLGYSVFVEWGYDKYLDNSGELQNMGSTLIDREFWEDKYDKSDYSKWLPEIELQRAKTSGNYDGAFGVISNFSWTFEDDGTYDISVEITSLGDVIESLKVNLPSVYISKGNAFYSRNFARMVENLDASDLNAQADIDTFYNIIFPGLWESIEGWYDRIIDGSFTPTSYLPVGDIKPHPYLDFITGRNLNFKENYYDVLNGKLGEDHTFLTPEGDLYNNQDIIDLTENKDYGMKQSEIRRAIEYAIAQWFSDSFECPIDTRYKTESAAGNSYDYIYRIVPRKARSISPFTTANPPFQKAEPGYITTGPRESFSRKNTYQKVQAPILGYENGKLYAANATYTLFDYNLIENQKEIRINRESNNLNNKEGELYGVITDANTQLLRNENETGKVLLITTRKSFNANIKKSKITQDIWWSTLQKTIEFDNTAPIPIYDEYGRKLNKNLIDYYSGQVPDQVKTPGITKDLLKYYIHQYFSKDNASNIGNSSKTLLVPLSEESKNLAKLEEESKLAESKGEQFSKQQELEKARSARSQEISDFKNQNKNRIYRFFYDVRQGIVKPPQPNNSSQKKILKIGDIKLPNGGVLGKIYNYIEDPSFYAKQAEINSIAGESKKTWKTVLATEKLEKLTSQEGYKIVGGDLELVKSEKVKQIKFVKDSTIKIRKIRNEINLYLKEAQKAKNILLLDRLSPVDNQGFIRLGFFLEFLNQRVIPKISSQNDNHPIISIDTNPLTNVCYVIDNVVSLDIQKIIINNDYFINGLTINDDENSGNNIPLFEGTSKYVKSLTGGSNIKYGQIMNIYFSFDRLQEIFDTTIDKNDVYLFGALKDICNDINKCLGNINNIEPVVDENNVIHLIDQTQIPGVEEIAKELNIPNFNIKEQEKLVIFGYEGKKSNFVRKIGLTTEISKNYATMITIGATANGAIPGVEATAFSRWNTGITDRFKNNITDATQTTGESLEPIKTVSGQEVQSTYATLLKETIGGNKGFGLFGLSNENNEYQINSNDIEYNAGIIEDFYKLMQAQNSYKDEKDKEGNTIESSVGFLPFNLKLDLDGISGIKIYNRMEIQQRFLPSNYPEALEFIITQVNHKLSNNDWVTSLETVATSKSVLTDKKKKPTFKK